VHGNSMSPFSAAVVEQINATSKRWPNERRGRDRLLSQA
jgi:hypothetical protein